MGFYQQGDQLFKPHQEKPKHVTLVENGVLVASPVTGHAHRAKDGKVWKSDDGSMFVEGPATIVHEEHGDINLPEGLYFMDTVREYDHLTEETRNVVD